MPTKTSGKTADAKLPSPDRAADEKFPDAIALLDADHREVEQLFENFRSATGTADKTGLALAICFALKVHAALEEELFYPAAMAATGEGTLLQEALVEHASARDLIAQIESGRSGEPLFEARVTVLGEYVAHHVREEERELFPRCRESGLDLMSLGETMLLRKVALAAGTPVSNPLLLVS